MLRFLIVSLATLTVSMSLCSAQSLAQHAFEAAANQAVQSTSKTISGQTDSTPVEDFAAERTLFDLANQRRLEVGAAALRVDARLNEAARAHARRMVERQQLSHHFDDEPLLLPRLLETGLRADHVGENVAYNGSAEKAFDALMQSAPHRHNLLDPTFDSAGFAAFWSNGRLYVVQDFAHRVPGISPASSR